MVTLVADNLIQKRQWSSIFCYCKQHKQPQVVSLGDLQPETLFASITAILYSPVPSDHTIVKTAQKAYIPAETLRLYAHYQIRPRRLVKFITTFIGLAELLHSASSLNQPYICPIANNG